MTPRYELHRAPVIELGRPIDVEFDEALGRKRLAGREQNARGSRYLWSCPSQIRRYSCGSIPGSERPAVSQNGWWRAAPSDGLSVCG
jgi:hypothetical protein